MNPDRACGVTHLYKLSYRWAKKWPPGLVNFVPAVAYHFCLNLPEKFSQPGAHFLAQPCTSKGSCLHNVGDWGGAIENTAREVACILCHKIRCNSGNRWQLFYSRDVDKCEEKSKLLSVPPSGSGTTTAAVSGTVVRSSSAPSDLT